MKRTRICTTACFYGPYFLIRRPATKIWEAFDRRPGEEYDKPVASGEDLHLVEAELEALTDTSCVQ